MQALSDHDTLLTTHVDSEEDSLHFSFLNDDLSYSVSPSAMEVVLTKELNESLSNSSFKLKKNYGSPVGDDINTRHVSGKKIDKKHTQFALSAGMMLGIRECVGGMNSLSEEAEFDETARRTLEEECLRVEKVKIPAGAYFITSHMASLPYRYKFKAYAPHIFSRIRKIAGVEKQRFLHSICGNDAFIEFVSNAKSGQFFFYSNDGRYMIKTQTHEEKNFLRQILPDYYNHLKSYPHSFVTHFYGMYRVKIPEIGKSVHFVIMKSVFNTDKEIHKIWDLKGSTLGRRSNRGEGVHKDLDFVEGGRKIAVGQKTKDAIMTQLKLDAIFLAKMRIMDYSLLIGVHVCAKGENVQNINKRAMLMRTNTPARRQHKQGIIEQGGKENVLKRFIESAKDLLGTRHLEEAAQNSEDTDSDQSNAGVEAASQLKTVLTGSLETEFNAPNPFTSRDDLGIESHYGDSKEIYFAGVIDILQLYNSRKWGETQLRKAVGNSEKAISCVNPDAYAERFVEFMDALIE